MNTGFGLAHFWAQGDAVTHSVAALLLMMSVASWYVVLDRAIAHWRARRAARAAPAAFWEAANPDDALRAAQAADGTRLFSRVAEDAVTAAGAWQRRSVGGLGGSADPGDYVARILQQSIISAQARAERGLTLLASVGATAPFVGLFGTVWGIYHALLRLSGSTQVVLDKVAGPVGEALIMTAAGLFVAIPAVLAYNAFTRANRLVFAQLDAFAQALHAWLVAGVRLGRAPA